MIGKVKSLAGRLVILSKVEVMKMETMKIAVFRDVTPCNVEIALCNIKITMTFTEQVPQMSTGLNWLRAIHFGTGGVKPSCSISRQFFS